MTTIQQITTILSKLQNHEKITSEEQQALGEYAKRFKRI